MSNHVYKSGETVYLEQCLYEDYAVPPPPGEYTARYDTEILARSLEACKTPREFNQAIMDSIVGMSPKQHLVQAQFTPGGKKYTYNCPGAEIGDTITGPGATGPAKVVAKGSTGYKGPIKTATILKKKDGRVMGTSGYNENAVQGQYTIEVRPGEKASKALKRALKKARKAEAREQELRAKKEAEVAERERRRTVALEALERNAKSGDTQAAVELLNS